MELLAIKDRRCISQQCFHVDFDSVDRQLCCEIFERSAPCDDSFLDEEELPELIYIESDEEELPELIYVDSDEEELPDLIYIDSDGEEVLHVDRDERF